MEGGTPYLWVDGEGVFDASFKAIGVRTLYSKWIQACESVFANTRHSQSSLAPVWHIIRDTERVQLSFHTPSNWLIALAWQEELSGGTPPQLPQNVPRPRRGTPCSCLDPLI